MIEIVTFSGTFANTGKDGVTTMGLGDVIDEFLNKHCFTDTGTTEESNLTTSGVGGQQVDHLDTGDQKVGSGTLVLEAGGFSVNGIVLLGFDGTSFVDGFTDNIHDTAQSFGTDRDLDGGSQVVDGLTTDQTISGVQSDGTHTGVSQMLSYFQN